jgi:hypothetical protein
MCTEANYDESMINNERGPKLIGGFHQRINRTIAGVPYVVVLLRARYLNDSMKFLH